MVTKPRLTAPQRARRKEIRELIRDGRKTARNYQLQCRLQTARLLDDLADIAEKYLEGMKHADKN